MHLRTVDEYLKKGGKKVTAQEIDEALFREEMAADAFQAEPSPANKKLWDEARKIVDRAIEEAG